MCGTAEAGLDRQPSPVTRQKFQYTCRKSQYARGSARTALFFCFSLSFSQRIVSRSLAFCLGWSSRRHSPCREVDLSHVNGQDLEELGRKSVRGLSLKNWQSTMENASSWPGVDMLRKIHPEHPDASSTAHEDYERCANWWLMLYCRPDSWKAEMSQNPGRSARHANAGILLGRRMLLLCIVFVPWAFELI